ncbi:hypothetical protein ASD11_16355 [Aeromicrobium sp. Root495]|uniref:DUF1684 domain-containing protein n=1 Tax=Aeromicrobium sp. Root495 TaxID=1736550 RepID=UPI00070031E9|nr:DUF1684 domain-containing protein [Aeromicrobium sp. Root495]KQY56205.1 hypothetical protein ASD11_16355 [Aeromicrobium sp. Root495]
MEASLVDWRLRVADLYAAVRADADHDRAHARWRSGRDELFRTHPQSPLPARDPLRETGLPYWPYDTDWRLVVPVVAAEDDERVLDTGDDGSLVMRRVGRATLPEGEGLDVWRMHQYAGGLFVPIKDGTSGRESYGAGRYVLDTAKGSWLGGTDDELVLDLNFAYHPSCRYDDRWRCPLAAPGNTIGSSVTAGERLS